MEYPMDLIVNVPYGPYTRSSAVITAENFESLLTEAVPEKAFKEFEEIRKTKWKHVNIKFCFQDLEIEYAVDLVKRSLLRSTSAEEVPVISFPAAGSRSSFPMKKILRRRPQSELLRQIFCDLPKQVLMFGGSY